MTVGMSDTSAMPYVATRRSSEWLVVEHVESGDAAAEHRHEVRQQALAEFRQRGGALQRSRHARHVRLHPALLVHRRGALLEDVDRARQAAGFVRRVA